MIHGKLLQVLMLVVLMVVIVGVAGCTEWRRVKFINLTPSMVYVDPDWLASRQAKEIAIKPAESAKKVCEKSFYPDCSR